MNLALLIERMVKLPTRGEVLPGVLRPVARLAVAIVLVVVILGIGAPETLGMISPGELSRCTPQVRIIRWDNIAPGDTFSDTMPFQNPSSRPLNYRLVFVRQGNLWKCDPGGNNLHYDIVWSPRADQRLKPGETETATVRVHFPLAAGNQCQGKTGQLLVRQGFVEEKGGVYECRKLPAIPPGKTTSAAGDSLEGCFCWDVGKLLHPVLGRR